LGKGGRDRYGLGGGGKTRVSFLEVGEKAEHTRRMWKKNRLPGLQKKKNRGLEEEKKGVAPFGEEGRLIAV